MKKQNKTSPTSPIPQTKRTGSETDDALDLGIKPRTFPVESEAS